VLWPRSPLTRYPPGPADFGEGVRSTSAETEEEFRDLDDEAMTKRVVDILESRRNDAYEAALAELRRYTQYWCADTLKLKPDELEGGEEPAIADAEGLGSSP
jgi:hypothetical protein